MLLLLSLLAGAAFAQDPNEPPTDPPAETAAPLAAAEASPTRLCADAAQGREVDVCLQLAAEHPAQADSIAAALRAHVDRAASEDRDLLQALLLLLLDATGEEGARQLGALGDPRAVAPLTHAGENRSPRVAVAATESLAHYGEGLEPLTRWLTDRDLPQEVRIASARSLGQLGASEGADALVTALRSRGVPPALRQAMLETLEEDFPERVGELEHQVSRDGTVWLAGSGAFALGYGLALVGHVGQAELAGLGAVTGAVAGGTAGWVAGRAWPMEAADAAFLTTNGVLGGTSGILIGSTIGLNNAQRTDAAWWGGLAGQAVGFGLGYGLRGVHPGNVGDSIEATLFAGGTAITAGTIVDFVHGWRSSFGDGRVPVLAAGLGFAGGAAIGHAIAPNIDVAGHDGWMILLGATYGTGVGILAPVTQDRRGLPWAGFALGGIAGYGLSGFTEPTPDILFGGTVGMLYGGAIGAGVGLLADPFDNSEGSALRGAALTGATLGLGIGAFAGWRNPEPVNINDVVLTGLVTSWATWQSVGWFNYAYPPPTVDGLFLIVPPAAGAATSALSPLLDVPLIYSFSGLSMGLWGGYLGATLAQLSGGRGDDILLWTLVGSDIGLAAGIGLAAPPITIPPLVLGIADAGAVGGGAMFALGASFFVDPRAPRGVDTILGASVGGMVVGFAGGALLGSVLHRSGRTRDVALALPIPGLPELPGRWLLMPAAFPGEEATTYGA
ncbi:MAG: HEAT repeat domain-containing protein, partial [Deltaproteobacteria bacterium]|nr:HEAT repeat domain-containing protein [Deltaproteobacteria bacterium]